ncbi:G-type lectin S-receptor-like serine/threonine-protein kinase [Thalictrum thalictroides]|uniref:Receptor-like serine/threonine-protein kinase n=1 Tax=Thalictrum thalictroides TaxID=46969 RepID=A0A7J6WV03_THATH|nr:G-type lectin S-receptor-like serine/threonine-protein kinase [Thalictrum thalictroides]
MVDLLIFNKAEKEMDGVMIKNTTRSMICMMSVELCVFLLFHNLDLCFTIETISPNELIRDSDSITSLNQTFKLGFFSPGNSSNRYVGIWYNSLPGGRIYIWVANRDNPLTDSSGVLRITNDGKLVVLDGKEEVVWTTNVSVTVNSSRAELLDSGNLVLRAVSSNESSSNSGQILWQSFEHPTDTLLQNMKFGANIRTGEKQVITSWQNTSDPSKGRFHAELEPLNIPQIVIWEGSHRHWRSGPWDGRIFIGVEGMYSESLNGFGLVRDEEEGNVYVTLSYRRKPLYVMYVLSSLGQLSENRFDEEENRWVQDSLMPETECDFYGKCGSFGFCDLSSKPVCICLKGYEPNLIEEWGNGNWSSGCVKRKPFQCEQNRTSSEEGKSDGFLKHERMKVPDLVNWVRSRDLEDCKQTCLLNCSCKAYSYGTGSGCMWWDKDLIDTQVFSTDGVDLYIRVAHSELDEKKSIIHVYIIIVLTGLVVAVICMYIFWRWAMRKRRKTYTGVLVLGKSGNTKKLSDADKLDPELPIFRYDKLEVSTNNFDLANKLGEGGFGSVYMGKLPSGQEIAVKRLSKSSGQGTEEFMNEVVVISKLQHRNLVRLLGCCIEGEEKMLVYEYMPNTSLDAFLFDPKKKELLGWKKCFQIIEGIGRGILYLHRDSRLRVIHRDLKPSNILLDKDLNPKISDFGMARIFGGDEIQANTKRVVGTYGYMSPEYAMEGLFSEKSDVYSFGVLLLEIVSGMRNTGFYFHEESVSLIRHAWKLWNEDKIQMLIDPASYDISREEEILRCIHVGLLCVQEYAKDRPTMSSTISMLTSEISSLPTPRQPAFSGREISSDTDCSNKDCSRNNVSITTLEGR